MAESFKPLRIDDIEIGFPFVLAPLAGYTDLAYRLICRRLGAPYCTTEMMLDRQLLRPGKLRDRFVHISDQDHPVAGQIIGNEPEVMAAAAAELCKGGFDVIDVNFACPVRKVLARRRGGWLLTKPELAVRIIQAVMAATDRPVTVKLRSGFDDAEAGGAGFRRIVEGAFAAGAAAVCVHARTVRQRYTGRADWDLLRRLKRDFPGRTIIGSGDLAGAAEAVTAIRQTGVDGVTLARAAIGNPWIFRQVADVVAGRDVYAPSPAEQRAVIEDHFAAALELYGPRRGPRRMRKFGIKYARMHPTPAKVRAAFVAVKTDRDWQEALEQHYAEDGNEDNAYSVKQGKPVTTRTRE